MLSRRSIHIPQTCPWSLYLSLSEVFFFYFKNWNTLTARTSCFMPKYAKFTKQSLLVFSFKILMITTSFCPWITSNRLLVTGASRHHVKFYIFILYALLFSSSCVKIPVGNYKNHLKIPVLVRIYQCTIKAVLIITYIT